MCLRHPTDNLRPDLGTFSCNTQSITAKKFRHQNTNSLVGCSCRIMRYCPAFFPYGGYVEKCRASQNIGDENMFVVVVYRQLQRIKFVTKFLSVLGSSIPFSLPFSMHLRSQDIFLARLRMVWRPSLSMLVSPGFLPNATFQ